MRCLDWRASEFLSRSLTPKEWKLSSSYLTSSALEAENNSYRGVKRNCPRSVEAPYCMSFDTGPLSLLLRT